MNGNKKIYNDEGQCILELDIINSEKGYGKEFDDEGKLIFEGEYLITVNEDDS